MLAPSKLNTSDLPDVESLMARIRAEAKAALSSADSIVPGAPKSAQNSRNNSHKSILYSDELNYLNANWHNWNPATEITSHRRFVGRFIVKIKRFFVDLVWNYVLKGYFERERQFHMHLVKHLNATARYIDARNEEIFWQLIEKVDSDIAAVVERADHLFQHAVARVQAAQDLIEGRLSQLESDKEMLVEIAERTHRDIVEVERFARMLENKVADFGHIASSAVTSASRPVSAAENICIDDRHSYAGVSAWVPPATSSDDISKLFRKYIAFLSGVSRPVVHIHTSHLCANGSHCCGDSIGNDLSKLLTDEGHKVHDICSALQISTCLSEFGDGSLGAICVRHADAWRIEEWQQFLQLCSLKLELGGRVVVEGTHTSPLVMLAHSAVSSGSVVGGGVEGSSLQGALEHVGFVTHEAISNSAYPYQGALKPIALSGQVPRRWSAIVSSINVNLGKLNDTLFGIERYCILAEWPARFDE